MGSSGIAQLISLLVLSANPSGTDWAFDMAESHAFTFHRPRGWDVEKAGDRVELGNPKRDEILVIELHRGDGDLGLELFATAVSFEMDCRRVEKPQDALLFECSQGGRTGFAVASLRGEDGLWLTLLPKPEAERAEAIALLQHVYSTIRVLREERAEMAIEVPLREEDPVWQVPAPEKWFQTDLLDAYYAGPRDRQEGYLVLLGLYSDGTARLELRSLDQRLAAPRDGAFRYRGHYQRDGSGLFAEVDLVSAPLTRTRVEKRRAALRFSADLREYDGHLLIREVEILDASQGAWRSLARSLELLPHRPNPEASASACAE